jgi:hypothetical protein
MTAPPTTRKALGVRADRIARTESSEDAEESERDIYFMTGYTVFDGAPDGVRRKQIQTRTEFSRARTRHSNRASRTYRG